LRRLSKLASENLRHFCAHRESGEENGIIIKGSWREGRKTSNRNYMPTERKRRKKSWRQPKELEELYLGMVGGDVREWSAAQWYLANVVKKEGKRKRGKG
jgi:hypothetical protein